VAAVCATVGRIRPHGHGGSAMKKILLLALVGFAAYLVVKKVRAAD